jgi:aspartyl-tRNA(Asn)/glutamyl-tRNA(Gln) amidotransferase subunit A
MSGTVGEAEDLLLIAGRLRRREVSSIEVVESAIRRAERLSPVYNAYITLMAEEALAAAAVADREIAAGAYRGPLHGVPLSIKDIYWTKGTRTTCGSRVLASFVPDEDAAVVARLRQAGAVLLAKANTYQFACSPPHEDFGPTRNPWNLARTTRGSSCGSAAAVAAAIDFGSFGSDTGGSIRVPAAFTGIAGYKPSFGLVSRFGMQAVSRTLDHAGPMARSVADAVALLQAVAGYDERDPDTRFAERSDLPASIARGDGPSRLDGVRIGLLTDFLGARVDGEIETAVVEAAEMLAGIGASIDAVSIPEFAAEAMAAHRGIMWPEAARVHREWFARQPGDYTAFSREKLAEAQLVSAVDYLDALERRQRLRRVMVECQETFDLLLLPAAPMVAPALETTDPTEDRSTELEDLGTWNAPFNLTGQPALSVPAGFSRDDLPIGLQILGRAGEDALVLRAGQAFQEQTGWHRRRPTVAEDSGITGPPG